MDAASDRGGRLSTAGDLASSSLDQHDGVLQSTTTTNTTIQLPLPEPLGRHPNNFIDYTDVEMSSDSSTSSPSSDTSELSMESVTSEGSPISPRGPPTLSFQKAAADAALNIQYAMDKYPTENITYMAEHFKKDPVEVEAGDRIELLEELPNFTMKVRVLSTGKIGLLPAWNMEDPFERLARLNMEFNEAVTCPAEVEAKTGEPTVPSCTLAHVHARCPAQTAQTRRQFVSNMRKRERENGGMSSDDSLPPTPDVEPHSSAFASTPHKSVKFTGTQRKVIFRYYVPQNLNKKEKKKWESDSDSDSSEPAEPEPEEADEAWWWTGWEEDPEAIKAAALRETSPMPASNPNPPVLQPGTHQDEKEDCNSRRGRHHRFRGRIRISAFKFMLA